jgi:CRP-like cAMP-binding protein
VKKIDGKDVEVKKYGPGDYFGEIAILRKEPRHASVIATTATTVVWLDKEMFD